jgi:hypothetical protein
VKRFVVFLERPFRVVSPVLVEPVASSPGEQCESRVARACRLVRFDRAADLRDRVVDVAGFGQPLDHADIVRFDRGRKRRLVFGVRCRSAMSRGLLV